MPTVAVIDGIRIQVYWDDHPPSHFHAEYGEYRASIEIKTLKIIAGGLPRAQYRKVVAWAEPRRNRLLEAWVRCQSDLDPGNIE